MVSLNALQLLTIMCGLKNCRDAGTGHRTAPKNGSLDDEAIFNVWLYAKKNGYIPRDDPIPLRAIKHIVVKHNIPHTTKDGLLDLKSYNAALRIVESDY